MSVDAPIEIVPYDLNWPRRFETERARLLDAIGTWLATEAIEHIGSTAIPGLAAKPVIDIMAGVASLEAARPAIAILERHQYCYAPYRSDVMHWFCKPSPAVRTPSERSSAAQPAKMARTRNGEIRSRIQAISASTDPATTPRHCSAGVGRPGRRKGPGPLALVQPRDHSTYSSQQDAW